MEIAGSKILFETERLYVRQFTMDDIEDFFLFNSDEVVMRYIRKPKTREEALQFLAENIEYYKQHPEYGRWGLYEKTTDAFAGCIMLRHAETKDDAEIGYALMPMYWGRGYATEALIGGIKYAFENLGLPTVHAITRIENIASQELAIKCGFRQADNIIGEGEDKNLLKFRKDKSKEMMNDAL